MYRVQGADQKEYGPISAEQVQQWIRENRLNRFSLAEKDGEPDWKPLEQFPEFAKAFPGETDPLTFQNIGVAIGAYERTLVTPSKWDEFLKGDDSALTDDQKRGLNTFVEVGCTGCHNGALLGGNTYMKLGLVRPWLNQSDSGRVAVTKNDSDSMVFKVAGLRNSTETAPYFHDGSAASLGEAISLMGQHQLGKDLTPDQVLDIATFLGSTKGTPNNF